MRPFFTPVSVPIPVVHRLFPSQITLTSQYKIPGTDQICSCAESGAICVFYLVLYQCYEAVALRTKLKNPRFPNSETMDKEVPLIDLYFNCCCGIVHPTTYCFAVLKQS